MSNKLLEEAVEHLRYWVPLNKPSSQIASKEAAAYNRETFPQSNPIDSRMRQWDKAMAFLNSIDMKMDEANAKHQDVLREVSDQQCIMMAEENNKRFPLHPCSPAEFRVLINKLLCASLVLEGEL